PASQPENPPEPVMGSDEADRRTLLALSTHPVPVARTTVPRHYPRQEPGALAALAGICAGGGERSPSLPRPVLPPRQQQKMARGDKPEEHAMSPKATSAIAVIGIDIGKNSFHAASSLRVLRRCWGNLQALARSPGPQGSPDRRSRGSRMVQSARKRCLGPGFSDRPLKSVMALPNQGSLSSPSRARARARCPNPTADDEILLLFSPPNAQAGHPLLLFSSPNAQAGRLSRRIVDPSRQNVDPLSRTVRQSYGSACPTAGPSFGQTRQNVGPSLGSERPSVGPSRG